MKICMLLNNNFVHDARVRREAKALALHGFEVVILAVQDSNLPEEEKTDGFTLKRVLTHLLGIPIKPWRWRQTRDFVTKAIATGADAYHAHDLITLIPGYLIKKKTGKKLIYDSHEFYTETAPIFWRQPWLSRLKRRFEQFMWRRIEKLLIKKADIVIASNGSIAEALQDRYKLHVLPVILRNFSPKQNIPQVIELSQMLKLKNKKIALFHGGITQGRGLSNLVEAAQDLHDDIVLVLMGDGLLKEDLVRYTKSHNLENKVFFVPTMPLKDLLSYTASADLGVIPYQNTCFNNYCSLPNKLFEYIQAGIPVAASNLPEIKKIVEKFDIGGIFNPENPKEMANVINAILGDKARYQKYCENVKIASEKLTWEKEKSKLIKIYDEIKEK